MNRICVIASASGSGKTTFARAVAQARGIPCIELDALVHGPNWTECGDAELAAVLRERLAAPAWIADGAYRRKVGDLVLAAADLVVWIDVPRRVWLPRLVRRTLRRIRGIEPSWNGNRETWRTAIGGRDSVIGHALLSFAKQRRELPGVLAPYRHVRLRSDAEVAAFVRTLRCWPGD